MYESFYGLRERPFELTPNPRFLFMTPRHREALTTLEYGLTARNGIALLVGDAGTGKTTLVHAALQSQKSEQGLAVYLNNPSLTRNEFIEFLSTGFGLSREAARSKTRCLTDLTELLAQRHSAGGMTALVIDEAQCLPDALLEEVRLLANIESASEKLLSIILAGQPELAVRLGHPSLRQLKQRVGAAVRARAARPGRHVGLYRRARPDRRRRCGPHVHARGGRHHPRTVGRHSPHDQRDLRQRAGVGLCARPRADRPQPDSRGLCRLRLRGT